MKKQLPLLFIAISLWCTALSQGFTGINYQAVARNLNGTVLSNKSIQVRFTITQGNTSVIQYQENQNGLTNAYGLFNLVIGKGVPVSGTFTTIPWATANQWLQVEVSVDGGAMISIGKNPFNAVPYALTATSALPVGPAGGSLTGSYPSPLVANGAIIQSMIASGVTLPPSGAAGGDLTGTYPNPLINIPLAKTSAQATAPLIGITNSSGTGTSGAIQGSSASTDANATAILGTISSTAPGGFSSAIRGINNGASGLGIGVWGSQNGSGWGVYGTAPSGIGVNASSTSGIGINGSATSGTGGRFTSTSGLALSTTGAIRFTGISEAAGKVLTTDAAGNATWQPVSAAAGTVSGSGTVNFISKWTPSGSQIGNSQLFDDGSNVGVGTTSPTYKFQVEHGGATGILSKSTSSFSVVDIDAASGDAALRFQKAGTGMWNTRNRPADDYMEWFELGGGGSRMVIQRGTGNVGIGETTNPIYKLDVLHGGSTGIRSRSSSSFSVVDIDAASGDAALRFQKAGTGMWNTRNRPADDYMEWFELGGGGSRMVIQRGTGNVGIGETTNPVYKLDVLHGGSTGIRSRSSSSFSVVDIDAASGDAALRFQKAGTGMWNTRNRPADDYMEWFELGGGGSRMVIQRGTGNVGIGETTNPVYKLDVLHGGSTGIRSRSSSSFSVVDIDAASGDAALRFQKAGVNMWNMRNRPADDYMEWFELGGGGSRMVIQRGTGNVGIGETTNPVYKLDVLHGGGTGAHIKSSSSFSVVDIDGASGDAALRFQNAGVGMWNTRNRPADDYMEWFELGGGGSRMVIQRGTGNVGIGETTNPTYKLDVLHGGATGIRSRSSSSFSVVDIDGANGDAALRFQKAGVNQWNIRNNPATDDLQFFELGGGGERMRIDNTTGKVWVNGDFTAVGVKAFTMDHPLDPENKILMHAAAESNEVINFYSGNITTDANGKAIVKLPDYFESINKDFRYQLTVIGTFAQAIVSKEVSNNEFEIATNQPNVKVSWEVKGVRNDAHMKKNPFVAETEKSTQQKGKYVDPAAYNQPNEKGISYDARLNNASSLNNIKPAPAKLINPANGKGESIEQITLVSKTPAKTVTDNDGTVAPQKSPLAQAPAKTTDNDGSVAPQKNPLVQAPAKTTDNNGSVAPMVKKEAPKPVVKSVSKGSTD